MKAKFEFTTEFQYEILKYTVQNSKGYNALQLYDDFYFTLTSHSFIAHTLKKYYKRKLTIPGLVVLTQEIEEMFNHRDFINNLTDADRKEILSLTKGLFKGAVLDGDELLLKTERFAQYVDLKNEVENIDLLKYDAYEPFSRKVQKAIAPRIQAMEDRGSFLSKDLKRRQIQRKDTSPIVPFPYKNLNRLTNAGGYIRNSLFVVLDAAKKWKTGMLVNLAKEYLKGYNVLVIDLDNGKGEFMMRVEQSLGNLTKRELLSGDYDKRVRTRIQKYKAIKKTEIIVKELPALITTAADIENYIIYLRREFGIEVGVLLIDYIQKMGSISGKESLHERVGEAYIDISNVAKAQDIAHVWTAQHVNKEGQKNRMHSVYEATDVAGATMDIGRHAQAIFGLNRTGWEEEQGYQRMEVVEQRDGKKGTAVFKIDRERQTVKELKPEQLDKFYEGLNEHRDDPKVSNGKNSYKGAKEKEEKRKNSKSDIDDAE